MFFIWKCEADFVYCKGGEGGRVSAQIKKMKKSEKMLGYVKKISYISTVIMIDMIKQDKKKWLSHVSYYRDKVQEENSQLKYQLETQKKSIQALIQRQIELSNHVMYLKSQLV
jgi:hypothetical protein